MIDKEAFHPLNFIKKEEYSGSMDGMRYMLKKVTVGEETKMRVTVWPEPFCMNKTSPEKMTSTDLPLTEAGVSEAADWLNEQYEANREKWMESLRRSLI